MIVILKRHDLPAEHHARALEQLQLEHAGLSQELIDQTEFIVFIEGESIKFLKHLESMQSKESLETLLNYLTHVEPEQRAWKWRMKKAPPRGKAKRREP